MEILPQHIAIIMDGNGRWAQAQGKMRHSGHKAGVDAVRSTIESCCRYEIPVLTLFAFSSENWKRPKIEVTLLMNLFLVSLKKELPRLNKNNIRLTVIGDVSAFSKKLQQSIQFVENETAENTGLNLQIAANYGGRWDIAQAFNQLSRDKKDATITEDDISSCLSFSTLPDPDLFIRTGGEQRISNFLLWQLSYAELYFTDTLWPDFKETAFDDALNEFSKRQRRFGKTSEQISEEDESA